MRYNTKVMPHNFLKNYNYNKIYTYHTYILYKAVITFPQKSPSSIESSSSSSSSSNLHEMLYAGHIKLYAEASELFTRTVFPLVTTHKTASSDCILWQANKLEAGEC
jgi:hypothetical protein